MATRREAMAYADVAWLRMEDPTNLMMIAGVMMFDTPMTLDDLKALVEERLLIFDRFRQRVTDINGSPHWELDENFDIDRHIHRTALPGAADQQELQALASDMMSTPLDFTKPLWQMHLVEEYGEGSAIVMRLHHCIADGIALIQVLISMADEYFDEANVPETRRARPSRSRTALQKVIKPVVRAASSTAKITGTLLSESVDMLIHPTQLVERARQGMSIGASTSRLLLLPADSDTVFKGRLGVTKRAAWSQHISLDDVKVIGKGVDAKVNDVLLAAVTGALRRYLLARDESTQDVVIRAAIPVNLRPLEEAFQLGNRFGLVFLGLPVGIDDAQVRLVEVKKRMDRIKASSEAIVMFGILQAAGAVPEGVQDQAVNLLGKKASAVMTNVPGPRQQLHLKGHPLRDLLFWVPRAGDLSLGVSIISYNGHVLIGVATDTKLVADPESIIEGIHEEFADLKTQFGA